MGRRYTWNIKAVVELVVQVLELVYVGFTRVGVLEVPWVNLKSRCRCEELRVDLPLKCSLAGVFLGPFVNGFVGSI